VLYVLHVQAVFHLLKLHLQLVTHHWQTKTKHAQNTSTCVCFICICC
jgi:hypothetical protein